MFFLFPLDTGVLTVDFFKTLCGGGGWVWPLGGAALSTVLNAIRAHQLNAAHAQVFVS